MRILVIEDDRTSAKLIRLVLTEDGYTVDVAPSGEEGRLLALVNDYDGIVLDLILADRHGLEILQELRRAGRSTPVLVLTGRDDTADVVRGLDAGADDYVIKPLSNEELRARVRALVRRGGGERRTEQLRVGGMVLNRLTRRVSCGGTELAFTPRELALLEHFMLRPGELVTRTQLLEKVWELHFDPGSNVVDAGVARLRRRLARCDGIAIVTVRGRGFRLATTPDGDEDGSGADGISSRT